MTNAPLPHSFAIKGVTSVYLCMRLIHISSTIDMSCTALHRLSLYA